MTSSSRPSLKTRRMTKMLKTFSSKNLKLLRRRKPSLSNNTFKSSTYSNLKFQLKSKELMTYSPPKTWLSKPIPSSSEVSVDGLEGLPETSLEQSKELPKNPLVP
jgi:hypothetical protein